MAITLRTTKGSELTHAELDANFTTLEAADAAHLADTADAHAASAITNTPSGNLAATDVQSALNELQGDIDAHVADTSAAHAASAISYAGNTNLSATTVEAALDELDDEKQPLDATLTAIANGSIGAFSHRNVLYNARMYIAQEGTSFTIPAGNAAYTLDGWIVFNNTNQSITATQGSGSFDSKVSAPTLRIAAAVAPTTGHVAVVQRVENVHTLAGRNVTASTRAASAETGLTPTVTFKQNFGSGGSAEVYTSEVAFDSAIADDLNPVYDVQHAIPSTIGKTIGSGNYVDIILSISIRSTNAVHITEVQLEEGTERTPFEYVNLADDLARCQRYYCTVYTYMAGITGAGTSNSYAAKFSVPMRAAPSVTIGSTTNTNTTGATVIVVDAQTYRHFSSGSSSGNYISHAEATASARL